MTKNKPRCVLTGYYDSKIEFDKSNPLVIDYTFRPIGRARIAAPMYTSFVNSNKFEHPILAGICRNAFANGELPPLIDTEFMLNGVKALHFPKVFHDKAFHLLRYMYFHGGKEFKEFDMHARVDYPLCYCENEDEFERIMKFLYERNFISFHGEDGYGLQHQRYQELLLTLDGINEIEKELPNVPLIGLASQAVITGNQTIDKQIEHSRYLFFLEPRSMNNMRSACETLMFILEPLRLELKTYFIEKDTEAFFQIVNNFDIRHNKAHIKRIAHEEQLEWVFYSLLNTVNTYYKLRDKLSLLSDKNTKSRNSCVF